MQEGQAGRIGRRHGEALIEGTPAALAPPDQPAMAHRARTAGTGNVPRANTSCPGGGNDAPHSRIVNSDAVLARKALSDEAVGTHAPTDAA